MKNLVCISVMICFYCSACAQAKPGHVGGPCEGCEGIYESTQPFGKLGWTDTLPDFGEPGQKLLVSGRIFRADGKTPAPGTVLYIYHTDQHGHYSKKGNETGWGKRHGYIRGWVRTDRFGRYAFYTLRPAAYPGRNSPAHIHATIKEAGRNEYYIDDFLFSGDPLLTSSERRRLPYRGGSGIMAEHWQCGMLTCTRNIILGRNIPGYLANAAIPDSTESGAETGFLGFQLLVWRYQ